MKKLFLSLLVTCLLICLFSGRVSAQTIPVGFPVLDDYYRMMQLLGKVDPNISFTIRPDISASVLHTTDVFDPDSSLKRSSLIATQPISFNNGNGKFLVLPLSWEQQFNSDHPYGWNDGSMIPARGYQTRVSGGFYFKEGPLSVQLRPEFVFAVNPPFAGYASWHTGQDLANYYIYHNQIDNPERYNSSPFNKLFWGQSSVKLTFGAIAMGISNENLWWGPGVKNDLVLTNNAPGFKHFVINTVRPIKTSLGYVEGEVIAGRLEGSGIPPLAVTALPDGTNLYVPKNADWRYFTGLNINYHPKWIHTLTLGLTRTFDAYEQDVKGFNGYFPFFFPYSKQATAGGNGDAFPRDQYTSFYARWLFQKEQAELYFEYGLNDNSYNLRDFIGSPEHSRAYLLGLRKMFSITGHPDQHILFSAEITQLSQSPDRIVRDAGGWYLHGQVTAGQTHLGQVLGAGTGSGGNLQSMDISWVSGLKKIGIAVERYEHDVDFYQQYLNDFNGNSRRWVDFAFALQAALPYRNLLFNAKLQQVRSFNYEWILKNYFPGPDYVPHNDVYNLHLELGATFRF